MFDNADILQCYRRTESIVPQQALALANSGLSIEMAGKIAGRLSADLPNGDDGDFIEAAFALVLGRSAHPDELGVCLEFCASLLKLDSVKTAPDPAGVVRARLVHALLNQNDFVTVR
jgi:hypothetical protein